MDIKHLRYFVGIAEAGSLMKAAERLSIAQPALSVHLANLEEDLGTRLVERTNRGIILTESGAAFYERAVALLQHHAESILAFKKHRFAPAGSVSVGMPSSLPALVVPQLYRAMREEYPDISLYLLDASSAAIYEWLQAGKIDFAVLTNFPENVGFQLTPLFFEDYCVVGRANGETVQPEIRFAEVFDRPLAVPSWATAWRKLIEEQAVQHGKALQAHFESESCTALRALALSGECDVMLPYSAVQADCEAGLLTTRRIIEPDLTGLYSLAHLNNKLMTPAMSAVHDLIVREVRALHGEADIERRAMSVRKLCPSSLFAKPRPIPRVPSASIG
jgi:LysR family nitrogen assimilation transcriptional regulator